MPSRKVLSNVEPFNDIFYENCFYNSLFPVVNHFGKSILPVLNNNIAVYTYDKDRKESEFDFEYLYMKPIEDLSAELGINMQCKVKSDNIVQDIIHAVESGSPVILWVDCFYESIRTDTFNKKHLAHTWLAYGYDDCSTVCNLIEHKNRETLTYKKCEIPYKDVVKSYKGYLENFHDGKARSFFVFSKHEGISKGEAAQLQDRTKYIKAFKDNTGARRLEIEEGIHGLYLFKEDLKRIISEEAALSEHCGSIVNTLNRIINGKSVERYKVIGIFGERFESVGLLNEIITHWDYLRRIIAKFMYSGIYRGDTLRQLPERIDQIGILEEKYLECTLGYDI